MRSHGIWRQATPRYGEPLVLRPDLISHSEPAWMKLARRALARKSSTEQAVLLHTLAARLLRFARRSDGTAGLGPAQVSALNLLLERGPMSIRALAEAEGVAHATMSRMISMLEEAGAVTKSRDEDDGRKQSIELTPKGRRLEAEARARRQRMVDEMVGMLRPETVDELIVVLGKLTRWIGRDD